MVHLEYFIKSLKVSWIRRILKSNRPWVYLFEAEVCPVQRIATFGSIWCDKMARKTKNDFWKDVLSSWKDVIEKKHYDYKNVYSPLLYGTMVKYQKKSCFSLPGITRG